MQSTSTDGGQTWAEPTEPAGIQPPDARFHIRRLASGRLLLVKHGDTIDAHEGREPAHAPGSRTTTARPGRAASCSTSARASRTPTASRRPDGTIYISYDRNRSTDGEILLARFTEDDILAQEARRPEIEAADAHFQAAEEAVICGDS